MEPKTTRCPICRRFYEVGAMYAGDQSKCPGCRGREREAAERRDTDAETERWDRYFGTRKAV